MIFEHLQYNFAGWAAFLGDMNYEGVLFTGMKLKEKKWAKSINKNSKGC